MSDTINYKPPPTIRDFIKDFRPGELFYDWIVGPVGSGKTTGIFFKLIYMAQQQAPSPVDGIRRSRAVVVRNTSTQLRDTTLKSWFTWFKDGQAGQWLATPKDFILRFGDVECEVQFRPLDTPDDIARVLSLEVTFAIIDEFVELPREIVDALSARCGRYPSAKDGGATNWGMWGSSNPSTEDNWWFDYLHNPGEEACLPPNANYFLQPSGFSDGAENTENLPGGRDYYTNQAKGKTEAWVKQFLEAEWGFSISGQPVVATFKADIHVAAPAKAPRFNRNLPMIIGFDPGIGGSAAILGQQDLHGRLLVLGELVQSGYGADRFVRELLKPYLRRRFPELDLKNVIIAPDPAAGNRTGGDEKTVVDILKRYFRVQIETNNRLPLRLNAIEHFTTRLVDLGPALVIDPKECPVLVRALKGGWRYALDRKRDIIKGAEPEKNAYSHPGDSFGYLCRYFHRQSEREERYSGYQKAFKPPLTWGGGYHAR